MKEDFSEEDSGKTDIITIEPELAKLESQAAIIIESVVREKSLAHLTEEDRHRLSLFTSVQVLRTPYYRELLRAIQDGLYDWVSGLYVGGIPLTDKESWKHLSAGPALLPGSGPAVPVDELRPATDGGIRLSTITAVLEESHRLAPLFLRRKWCLAQSANEAKFCIGDHPVAQIDFCPTIGAGSAREVGGLASIRTQIALPMSPELSILMYTPETIDFLRACCARLHADWKNGITPKLSLEERSVTEHLAAFDSRGVVEISKEEVEEYNSFQATHALRYIYASEVGSLEKIRGFLGSFPEYREFRGPVFGWPK